MSEFQIEIPLWAGAAMLAVGVLGAFYFLVVDRLITAGSGSEGEVAERPVPSPNSGAAFIVICIITVGLIAAILSVEFPEYEWTHPTLPDAEQQKVVAECEMRAAEAIQGGAIKDMARHDYTENCLVTEGFTQERVEEGGGE